jgi:uncharacterized lipoprotein NlpE involved in copper resistance
MKKILILALFSLLFLSCDEGLAKTPVTDASLNGSWNMYSYVAFMDALPVLENGDITWTFNNNSTVTVANTVEEEYPYMLDSGTYNFTIEDDILSIENSGSYHYNIEGNTLVMEHVAAPVDGGPILSFSKN